MAVKILLVSYERGSCIAHIKHIVHSGTVNVTGIIIDNYLHSIYRFILVNNNYFQPNLLINIYA